VKGATDIRNLIKFLSTHLQQEDAVLSQEEILSAKVPILRVREKETQVDMDITFNIEEGIKALIPIKNLLQKYSPLKPLVLILKAFLKERKLNETYYGGIGSFLQIIMMAGFLQYIQRSEPENYKNKNLGELLLRFFKFYGEEFNYKELGISIIGNGCFYKKNYPDNFFSIENPEDIDLDIGKSVRLYEGIMNAFRYAYDSLCYFPGGLSNILHSISDLRKK